MAVNVYEVEFEETYNSSKEWLGDRKTVLANGSAEAAIKKVRKRELATKWKDDATGKMMRVTGFRLVGVKRLMEVDIP